MCDTCKIPEGKGVVTDVNPEICPFVCPECHKIVFPMKPLRDIVCIWPLPEFRKLAPKSSLILVTNQFNEHQNKPNIGLIIACGPGYTKNGVWHGMELEPGLKAVFDNTTPWHCAINNFKGKTYSVRYMTEQDVSAVVEED